MCIIVVKPKGQEVGKKVLKRCFENNDDGAGFVYNSGGINIIRKGFFDFNTFYNVYSHQVKKENPAIIHFRIATAGKVDAGNCHPFPLVDNISILRATYLKTHAICVAHNGMLNNIEVKNGKISDTIEFIVKVLSNEVIKKNIYDNEAVKELVRGYIGNDKLAFINRHGEILLIGDFIEDKGVLYSNNSYKTVYRYTFNYDYGRTFGRYTAYWKEEDQEDEPIICGFCNQECKKLVYNDIIGDMVCDSCDKWLSDSWERAEKRKKKGG